MAWRPRLNHKINFRANNKVRRLYNNSNFIEWHSFVLFRWDEVLILQMCYLYSWCLSEFYNWSIIQKFWTIAQWQLHEKASFLVEIIELPLFWYFDHQKFWWCFHPRLYVMSINCMGAWIILYIHFIWKG